MRLLANFLVLGTASAVCSTAQVVKPRLDTPRLGRLITRLNELTLFKARNEREGEVVSDHSMSGLSLPVATM